MKLLIQISCEDEKGFINEYKDFDGMSISDILRYINTKLNENHFQIRIKKYKR